MRNIDEKNLSEKLISASKRLTNLVSHETPHKLVKEIYEEMQIFGIDKVFDIYFEYLDSGPNNQNNLDAAFTSIILMDEFGNSCTKEMAAIYLVEDIFHGMQGVCESLLNDFSETEKSLSGDRFLVDAYTEALRIHKPFIYRRNPRYIWSLANMAMMAWNTVIGEGRLKGRNVEDVLFRSVFDDYGLDAITLPAELTDWIVFLSQYNLDMKIIIKNLIDLYDDEMSFEEGFEYLDDIIKDFEDTEFMELYNDISICFDKDALNKAVGALKTFKKISKL